MQTILFVCQHGAAKSVLAAAMFQQLAQERGLPLRAASAGTEPDSKVHDTVMEFLRSANLPLPGHAPRLVTDDDLKAADRVVSFGCNLDDRVPLAAPVLRWDDVPLVSQDLRAAVQEIRARVEQLVGEQAASSRIVSDE